MGFLELLATASMPVLQIMLVGLVGAFLASGYSNALTPEARKHMNKVVYLVFMPSLMFASLAKTVTLEDIISWWFMPVNIGLTFLIGGTLGWIAAKLLRPQRHLQGLIIATCSAGNLGNLMIIVVPAICDEDRSPFGEPGICRPRALSYASFSMALGGFYIWTHTYSLMKNSGALYKKMRAADGGAATAPNKDVDAANRWAHTEAVGEGTGQKDLEAPLLLSTDTVHQEGAPEHDLNAQPLSSGKPEGNKLQFLERAKESLLQLVEELISPPTVAAALGFIFGATPWLKSLIIGASAPLRVVQDSLQMLGDGTIPCITLIMGGNLTQGIRKSNLRLPVVLAVLCLRFVILPASGMAVVKAAGKLGFLPQDPLYHYVLLLQYALPPAMNIGTMAELFDVAQEECSVLFLWTYLVAAFALTSWSMVFMWFLS
uniref:Putative transporter C5D6.04 n=1 Tax=Anthurium amnicola TaxID=1678845 RepID=A0A1D1ZJ72_9ARAE